MNLPNKQVDQLVIDLLNLKDYDYLEKVLDSYYFLEYDKMPAVVAEEVAKTLERRKKALKKINSFRS